MPDFFNSSIDSGSYTDATDITFTTSGVTSLILSSSGATFPVPLYGDGSNLTGVTASVWNGGTVTGATTFTNNLGIGVLSALTTLHIASTTPEIRVFNDNTATGSTSLISFGASTTHSDVNRGAAIQFTRTNEVNNLNGDLQFLTRISGGLTEKMIIKPTGNVGIGTSTPQENLHVSGNTIISGGLTASTISGNGTNITNVGGIHYPFAKSGDLINLALSNNNKTTLASVANRIDLSLFFPAQDFNISEFSVYCSSFVASANTRVLVYSDLSGRPDQKLFESGDLDCSTIGHKSYVGSFSFEKGVKYWVGTHASSTATLHALSVNCMMPISTNATSLNNNSTYRVSAIFGSAPSTMSGGVVANANHSQVMMLIA